MIALLGWDSMASKLRRVSLGSNKGNGFKVDDLVKKIGTTVKSLYDRLVASFSKILGKEPAAKENVPKDASKDTTSTLDGLGYKAFSAGGNVIYINLGTDEDIFNEAPVFKKIESVSEAAEEDKTLLVSASMPHYEGLPVEPLEPSSVVESNITGTVTVAGAVTAPTATTTDVDAHHASTVDERPVPADISLEQTPARNQDVDGIPTPELRRIKAVSEPTAPMARSVVASIEDQSDVITVFHPELNADKDDISVGSDFFDLPDDGMDAYIPEEKTVAPVAVPEAIEVIVEPLAEGEYESGITVAFPFESADIDVSEGPVFMDSFVQPEVFREVVIAPVIKEDIVVEVPSAIVEAPVAVQPEAVESQHTSTVTFSFGAQGGTDGCMVRFIF
jgi:hypothetical protein